MGLLSWAKRKLKSEQGPTAGDLASKHAPVVGGPLSRDELLAQMEAGNAARAGSPLALHDRHLVRDLGTGNVGASMNTNIREKMFNRRIGGSDAIKGFFKGREAMLNFAAGAARIGGDFNAELEAASTPALEPGEQAPNGIKKNDVSFATRAVASSALDKLLGTNVIAASHHAVLNGEKGYISANAAGEQFYKKGGEGRAESYSDVDLSRPAIQRQLADLQVNDFLAGQVDRHPGNVFIDNSSGKVTGIDNDLAFGERVLGRGGFGIGSNQGLPSLVDARTAKRILSLKSKNLTQALHGSGLGTDEALRKEEIQAAVDRLRTMKSHVRQLKKTGGIVDEWNQDTYQALTGDVKRTGELPKDSKGNTKDSILGFIEWNRAGFRLNQAERERAAANARAG